MDVKKKMTTIGIIADFDPNSETHRATDDALRHSSAYYNIGLKNQWIATDDASPQVIKKFDGLLFSTGMYRNTENTIGALKFAREKNIPTLATCGGFQQMVIELGRNLLGYVEAAHAEYQPNSPILLVTKLSCSLAGREMEIQLRRDSKVFSLYGKTPVTERYYCNYGVNPQYVADIEKAGIEIVGSDREGIARLIELPHLEFFVGTLFVPQASSAPDLPHPIVTGFLHAAHRHSLRP